jgi:hypothetical protein
MSRKLLAFLITIWIIILLASVGVGITYILRVTNIDSNVRGFLERTDVTSYTTVTTIVSSPVSDLDQIQDKITPLNNTTSKLTSDILKLTFNYQNTAFGFDVSTTKKGNKISIKSASQSEATAQYIELFSKKSDETFGQAISRIFLEGVPENFCYFKSITTDYKFDNTAFALATIEAGTGVRPEQCPGPYTANSAEGPRFFLYDPNFPDRFGFVYVGDTFLAGSTTNSNWFESLSFIK